MRYALLWYLALGASMRCCGIWHQGPACNFYGICIRFGPAMLLSLGGCESCYGGQPQSMYWKFAPLHLSLRRATALVVTSAAASCMSVARCDAAPALLGKAAAAPRPPPVTMLDMFAPVTPLLLLLLRAGWLWRAAVFCTSRSAIAVHLALLCTQLHMCRQPL